jgi:hypothetical protein
MRIDTSTVHLSASHVASIREEVRETVRAWVGNQPPEAEGNGSASSVVALSAAARDAAARAADKAEDAHAVDASGKSNGDPFLNLIRLVIEMLTGVRVRTVSPEDFKAAEETAPPPDAAQAPPEQPARAGFGLEYEAHARREETEQTAFNAEGVVHTADGKEIHFNLALMMARSHVEESHVSLRAGDAVLKDPLVINFGGTAAQLHGGRFKFDLDGDGTPEDMPMLSGNSGFLALDLDGNGSIDSGKELFGPSTGNGFGELAQYDSDGNGWIDENDPAFAQLGVWTPGAGLKSLKDSNVGALYAGNVESPFQLKDDGQALLGEVRNSGIYLTEDGKAGSLQQIDVVI